MTYNHGMILHSPTFCCPGLGCRRTDMGIHRRDLDETPFRDGSTPIKHHFSIIFVRFKATCSKCSVHVSINNTQWPNAHRPAFAWPTGTVPRHR